MAHEAGDGIHHMTRTRGRVVNPRFPSWRSVLTSSAHLMCFLENMMYQKYWIRLSPEGS
jgi:hypothetical protein